MDLCDTTVYCIDDHKPGLYSREMETFANRFKRLRLKTGLTLKEIAESLGISYQAVQGWEAGKGMPRGEARQKAIATILKTTPSHLLYGDEIDLGPAIETPLRPVVVVESPDDIKHEIIEVPRYTLKASAGTGQPVLEIDREGTPNYCRAGWARDNGYKPELLFSMRMCGTSMLPTIPDGASLMVYRQTEIESGRVHIVCRDGECFVKRLYKQMDGSLLIHSDNDAAFKDILLQPGDPIELYVVGTVVSMSTNL